ncbi:MAG TPA: DUF2064 domain-containing protein [Jatrophihabitans sp.]|nr:DUF2064 domain-containing protein [Jatrophihabitans sp.]
MSVRSLVLIAKAPVAGRVKTRLISDSCSATDAAQLAGCAIADTLAALQEYPCDDKVILIDGAFEAPAGWRLVPQVGGGLDQRLAAGFEALPTGPALLVGMDTPQLTAELLQFDPSRYDACLGLAADGGYWAIGFTDPAMARRCIEGVPMSTDSTGAEQLRRMQAAGLHVQLLPMLTDVDTAASAAEVAAAAPGTSFARLWREIAA